MTPAEWDAAAAAARGNRVDPVSDDLSAAWKAVEEVLPAGADFSLSFVANGPDAGWYAIALRPAMSMHDYLGPLETKEAALLALRDRLTDTGKENRE